MNGQELYNFLRCKNINNLYHANSMKTSVSLLKLKGLASRKYVEDKNLPQTIQATDAKDKMFGIWNDIFVDTIDIHKRGSRRNHYGPVLFCLDIKIFLSLPNDASVFITKSNPSKWTCDLVDSEKYFLRLEDLAIGFSYGTFDQTLVIRLKNGFLSFDGFLSKIILDDPCELKPSTVFNDSMQIISKFGYNVFSRDCRAGCKCVEGYNEKATKIPHFFGV
ncbi:MAG: hypothetical protein RLY71_382 [Pseudomonadota bacterium]|jgi:hypothetical protein